MRCYARYLFLLVVAVLGFGQMLAACGQKGPLYHPGETQDQAPAPETEQPADQLPPLI